MTLRVCTFGLIVFIAGSIVAAPILWSLCIDIDRNVAHADVW